MRIREIELNRDKYLRGLLNVMVALRGGGLKKDPVIEKGLKILAQNPSFLRLAHRDAGLALQLIHEAERLQHSPTDAAPPARLATGGGR